MKLLKKAGLVASGAVIASPAFAAVDYSGLTTAANFSDATTAVLAVAGALAGVYVVIKGINLIIGMMRK